MKTITIDGVEYNLTPIKKTKKKKEPIVLEQNLKFEVYPKDLGQYTWHYAKELCEDLGDGWRLPTREELHLMYLNKDEISCFAAASYWSSGEYNTSLVWYQNFNDGNQYYNYKHSTNYVRAVRDVTITEKGI
jgi:hypothetical protein